MNNHPNMGAPQQAKTFSQRTRRLLSADGLIGTVRQCFENIQDHRSGNVRISLADCLMTAFSVFFFKYPSLLAFDKDRKSIEENLKAVMKLLNIPCDTQLRSNLDGMGPENLRPGFTSIHRNLQRGKALEKMVFLDGHYLLLMDGTQYFSSEKLHAPFCMQKETTKEIKKETTEEITEEITEETKEETKIVTTYYLQLLGAVLAHPDRKEVIPFMPEPISKQDGTKKNDCEINASKRFIKKLRKDHPHLKLIVVQDAISPNGPYIRFLKKHNLHFILGVKNSDHAFLFEQFNKAIQAGTAGQLVITDPNNPNIQHEFVWANQLPINASHPDVLVNILSYWQVEGGKVTSFFDWVTDFTLNENIVYQIMRAGRARWKVENETFNTLKNQGYHLEHNYGLGQKHLSIVFVTLMMLAFLVDQSQQLCCQLFNAAWTKAGSKKALWRKVGGLIEFFLFESIEIIYHAIVLGIEKTAPQIKYNDSS